MLNGLLAEHPKPFRSHKLNLLDQESFDPLKASQQQPPVNSILYVDSERLDSKSTCSVQKPPAIII